MEQDTGSLRVDAGVKIAKVGFEIPPVVPPGHAVHPRSRSRAKRPVGLAQTVDGDVMQERGERTCLSCRASWRTRSRSLDTPCPALRPGRVSLAVFPSGKPLSSTVSATTMAALFDGFSGTTGLSDFPRSFIENHRQRVALAARQTPTCHPTNHPGRGIIKRPRATVGSPGSRAWSLRACPGSSTAQGSPATRDSATGDVAFRLGEHVGTPNFISISRLNSPARTTPVNASLRPHGSPTHDSGPP